MSTAANGAKTIYHIDQKSKYKISQSSWVSTFCSTKVGIPKSKNLKPISISVHDQTDYNNIMWTNWNSCKSFR